MYVAKTKVLISCAVTMQLICAFVFAYAKSMFSPDAAHLIGTPWTFHLTLRSVNLMNVYEYFILIQFNIIPCRYPLWGG